MRFEVWAPYAESGVDLVMHDRRYPMRRGDSGWWHVDQPAEDGDRYWFSLDGGEPLPDPRARALPDGPDGPAQVVVLPDPDEATARWRGSYLPGSVLYEMHVGTFTDEGTLDAATRRLDHLVDLGIDMVELMPLATFPGQHGWGYDGVGLYAVHDAYGGPAALRRFVDACHARGLGVLVDVVYNHLGPSGNHLQEFGPYFTRRYETPWGEALNLDGPGSDAVRRFIIDNALLWLRDYGVDGLRLDAVHALFDERAVTLLEELAAEIIAWSVRLGRRLWLVAESDRNDPLTVTPREAGGLGLDAQWADDVHHALHVLLTGETHGYYADFGEPGALRKVLEGVFLHDGTYSTFRERTHGRPVDRAKTPGSRFVVSLQNHDQVGNRAQGDRLSAHLSPGRLACGAALLLTGAGTPMLFMGEEWGASTPWQYFTDHTEPQVADAVRRGRREEFAAHGWDRGRVPDPQSPGTVERSRLDWSERDRDPHHRLLEWYRALLRLRRVHHGLRDPRLDRLRVEHDAAAGVVVVHRGRHRVVANLGDEPQVAPLGAGSWEVLLAWDPRRTVVEREQVRLPAESAAILTQRPAPRA